MKLSRDHVVRMSPLLDEAWEWLASRGGLSMLGLERYQPLALRAEDRSRPDTANGRAGQCREVKQGAGFGVRSRL
jgi:hypothetical protein